MTEDLDDLTCPHPAAGRPEHLMDTTDRLYKVVNRYIRAIIDRDMLGADIAYAEWQGIVAELERERRNE